ncbi:MAG: hypothetical protein HOG03_08790 [Desulfobacula sp.]|jgi:hypothetical protein|uniref:hypothetical protein n=1 Tax=Desulfobacula sp. TaxID=2593537 RepID=UPI001D76C2FD|nr:hypothetical protein [Desulfobacula sp.]MBT3484845.1 hypothetical protein [Desulfobacula sp.]MBT3804685.1 hypothetical protein [Desulfobacula sp.]MBT4024035.1 hypothetical protein [Desulfobacula sp.]MBT4198397.1 hypothetical protein [Desulfobacula sp.]
MKKIIATTTSVLVLTFFSTVSAHADKKTVEGFMLGTGIAILSAAIYNGIQKDSAPQYKQKHSRHDKYSHSGRYEQRNNNQKKYYHKKPRGSWTIEKIWVDPIYEKKWNPAHYNHRGKWVSGRHEKFLVQNGFWQEKKIWVWN